LRLQGIRAMTKIDDVWALLEDGKGRSAHHLAKRLSLPTGYVIDVLFFFVKYGFAEIEIDEGGAILVKSREGAPPISAAIKIVNELAHCPSRISTILASDL